MELPRALGDELEMLPGVEKTLRFFWGRTDEPEKKDGRQVSTPRRPKYRRTAIHSKLLNGVLVVIRVAVTLPVMVTVTFPLIS